VAARDVAHKANMLDPDNNIRRSVAIKLKAQTPKLQPPPKPKYLVNTR